ncbi:cysteine methyltransferase [Bacillus sp. FJAT-27264]|uniref:methylated-DNA--[protein]-cysteine S-methyltransferase n=1 Tax=Paenibacillus sp. (strain DSM 101736 / FJAT-27264) TaxID=1850362 RepID=UPI000807D13D|nr:methylated-DNA--[protein]-cysteine S-methyltransferase [Bacillus sp. FJAT-27264]OBZ18286.1 cysteine methyltransferase [Bacillus sp. FJAT-27264]
MSKETCPVIYWTLLDYKEWHFYIATTEQGLCYIGSQGKLFSETSSWAARRFPGSPLVEDEARLRPYLTELKEYLNGERQNFISPADLIGTPFQLDVWRALREIPYGSTWSYSDIAERIGRPSAVRAVGTAIGANPVLITVPCHRVIGKNGSLTGFRGGLEMKKRLLELEQGKDSKGALFLLL